MTIRRKRPTELSDFPEQRNIPLDQVEVREEDENTLVLTGYASTFQEYEMYGGPSSYGWIERIDPGAFEKTLREKPDLHLLVNHEGMPLARTKSGTLTLSVDDHGLKVEAKLDRSDPDVQRLEPKMRRKDMDEMSFAFRVKDQEWKAAEGFDDDEQSYRVIREVSLHKGDVSVVNFGANPTTNAELKSFDDALRMIADGDLAEVRSDSDLVKRVQEKLSAVTIGDGRAEEEGVTRNRFKEGVYTLSDVRELLEGIYTPSEEALGDKAAEEMRAAFESRIAELEAEIQRLAKVEETEEEPKKGMSLRLALALADE